MTVSKKELPDELYSKPFIFVPLLSGSKHEDVVSGIFLSSNEVYWNDSTGSMDQIKDIDCQCSSVGASDCPLNKTLCSFYPSLHDFFVVECGVHESPPLRSYLQILQQLSSVTLPSQAANSVSYKIRRNMLLSILQNVL